MWSKSEKKYKTIRRIIGKIDPDSGQIVPTGPRGRPRREPREPISDATTTKKTATASLADVATSDVRTLNATIAELRIENSLLISEREKITGLLDNIMHFAEQARDLLDQSDNKPNN